MASQLREVLNRFTEQSAPVSLSQMAHEMNLAPAVLCDMIDYWVRKGKLREVGSSAQACTSCGTKGACPFVAAMPRYYELVQDGETSSAPPCTCSTKSGCH